MTVQLLAATAALIAGPAFAVAMNLKLELGQPLDEQLACGAMWSCGMISSFIMGTALWG